MISTAELAKLLELLRAFDVSRYVDSNFEVEFHYGKCHNNNDIEVPDEEPRIVEKVIDERIKKLESVIPKEYLKFYKAE